MNTRALRSSALIAVLAVAAIPAALRAQDGGRDSVADASVAAVVVSPVVVTAMVSGSAPASAGTEARAPIGPRATPAGIAMAPVAFDADRPQQGGGAHMGAGSNVALMGVGAAAIVVGLLVGGDGGTIIAVSGGVIGLLGLYRFLR